MLRAWRVTTGSYEDTMDYGVIIADSEETARYHLDRAQLHLAREARGDERSETVRVLRMFAIDLINSDVLVDHTNDDPITGTPSMPRGTVGSA